MLSAVTGGILIPRSQLETVCRETNIFSAKSTCVRFFFFQAEDGIRDSPE